MTESNKANFPKNIPLNKYSIHDLKNAIDTRLIEYLETKKFKEIHTYSNLKIILGLFCLICTIGAYLNGLPFNDAYWLIFACVVLYFIASGLYWYLEKRVIKSVFYTGKNIEILPKLKYFRMSSEIEDFSQFYTFWLSKKETNDEINEAKEKRCFSEFFDDRGYCIRSKVNAFADEIIERLKGNKKSN